MRFTTPFAALLLSALVPEATALAQKGKPTGPPPGMVEIPEGRFEMGTDVKEIEAMLEATPTAEGALRALDAETPQHRVNVPAFYISPYELSNEQYRPFVQATGHRPPIEWGSKAIDDARKKFLEDAARVRQEAVAAGQRAPERKEFDAGSWWTDNWEESAWAMPEESALQPVSYVDFADALAYCKWAGVRLPTEIEWQRAARGDTKNPFPWGEEWDDKKYANTNLIKGRTGAMPIGSFPDGKSPFGIYDLSGNVWEWTSSEYLPYEGFKKNKYTLGRGSTRRSIQPEPTWDANQRVVTGGSWQNGKLPARLTARRPTERSQLTNALGFRTAASGPDLAIGVDIAAAVFDTEVKNSDARASGTKYLPNGAVAIDRWETADRVAEGAPEGYAVITKYDFMMFVPIEELADSQDVTFRKATIEAPAHLGFLSTTEGIVEPSLAPGTYLIAFRAAGKRLREVEAEPAPKDGEKPKEAGQEPEKPKVVEVEDPLAALIDIKQDNLIFYDARTGEFVTALKPVSNPSFKKGDPGGAFKHVEKTIWKKDDAGEDVPEIQHWMTLEVGVASKIRKRVWPLHFEFMPEPGTTSKNWRE